MTAIAERVAAGAAFLDRRNPGWWRKDRENAISLPSLNIESLCNCVLGQLFGHYSEGLRILGDVRREPLGFMWEDDYDFDEIDALTAEWVRVITGRRAAS